MEYIIITLFIIATIFIPLWCFNKLIQFIFKLHKQYFNTMGNLMSRFDTSKPIFDTIIQCAEDNHGDLSDADFNQILSDYGAEAEEETFFELMMFHATHQFVRHPNGWTVISHE